MHALAINILKDVLDEQRAKESFLIRGLNGMRVRNLVSPAYLHIQAHVIHRWENKLVEIQKDISSLEESIGALETSSVDLP